MPKLLVFVACRRVLVDELDKTVSLISLFDRIEIQVPPDADIPSQLLAPIDWVVYSWWGIEPEDKSIALHQRVILVSPQKEEFTVAEHPFDTGVERQRFTLKSDNFPVDTPGVWNLKLLLRREEEEWQEKATYPITVAHKIVELPQEEQSQPL